MAATVETCKPIDSALAIKEQRPKRDFLREHREYLRNIQKNQKAAKTKSAKNSGPLNKGPSVNSGIDRRRMEGAVNDTLKSEAFNRLTAKPDRTKITEKRFGTFISKNMEARKRAGAITNMLDVYVQTCDPELESFLEGAKLLAPSDAVLEAIRAMHEPPPEPKPRPIRRRIDRHTCVLNAHLSDLKEFLEKGSVSRRKRNETQKNPNIQKFLARGRMNLRGRNSRPNVGQEIKKAGAENRIVDNFKSSILFGAGESGIKSTVKNKLPKLTKKDGIGDGPKRSEGNQLIVVYQKE